jgi:hypothetical protein
MHSNYPKLSEILFSPIYVISPILLASIMAFSDGVHNLLTIMLCLLIFLAIQFVCKVLVKSFHVIFPYPIIFAMIFMLYGVLIVPYAYYSQSKEMNFAILLTGLTQGCLILACVLAVIIKSHRKHQHMLPVKLKVNMEILENLFLIFFIIGSLLPIFIYSLISDHVVLLLCPVILLFGIPEIKNILTDKKSIYPSLKHFDMLKLYAFFTVIFALGWLL